MFIHWQHCKPAIATDVDKGRFLIGATAQAIATDVDQGRNLKYCHSTPARSAAIVHVNKRCARRPHPPHSILIQLNPVGSTSHRWIGTIHLRPTSIQFCQNTHIRRADSLHAYLCSSLGTEMSPEQSCSGGPKWYVSEFLQAVQHGQVSHQFLTLLCYSGQLKYSA